MCGQENGLTRTEWGLTNLKKFGSARLHFVWQLIKSSSKMVRVDVFVSLDWCLEEPSFPKKLLNAPPKQFFVVSSENTAFSEEIVQRW